MVALYISVFVAFFFFFSSRRRHTRSLCDWSSDVCSSDLGLEPSTYLRVLDTLLVHGYPLASFMPLGVGDRKSTRLNSIHTVISYAVFCLKKKKNKQKNKTTKSNQKKIHISVNITQLHTRS